LLNKPEFLTGLTVGYVPHFMQGGVYQTGFNVEDEPPSRNSKR
jgi:hypothetical protein